jgi:LPXTG-motif cell wall-anchored protein
MLLGLSNDSPVVKFHFLGGELMRDSLMPPNNSGGNKAIIILMIGGVLLLGAAGVILYKRQTSPPQPPPPPLVPETDIVGASAPLVIAVPTRPRALSPADAGPKEPEKAKKVRANKGQRLEKVGTIDAKAVKRFVQTHFHEVKSCYEHRLKTNSFLEGKLDMNIGLASSGRVTSIAINKDTVRDSQMLGCVKRKIRGWQFPKPEGGRVVIAKTFSFKKKL